MNTIRLELRLKKKYIQGITIQNLHEVLQREYFHQVHLMEIEFIEPVSGTRENRTRFFDFKSMVNLIGLKLTKQRLNGNRQFNRDYGKFYKVTSEQDLDQIFRDGIQEYFFPDDSEVPHEEGGLSQ